MLFLSLAPNAINESGHDVIYQKCLEAAARRFHCFYVGLLPKRNEIKALPRNWIPFFHQNRLLRIFDYFRIFLIRKRKTIFIESFQSLDFIFFTLACLLFSRREDRLMVLFRYEIDRGRFKKLRAFLGRLCKNKMSSRFVLLTDSELIARDCEPYFKQPLVILPIPHVNTEKVKEKGNNKIVCWWPGPPRRAKGYEDLLRIVQLPFRDPSKIEIVAAKQSQLPSTTLISNVLERKDYLAQLHASDFVLLPYDPNVYKYGTSGIFVEAIIARKIPLVKQGSWLAYELKKYQLDELIIDWENPYFFLYLPGILESKGVAEKLDKMGKDYTQFHSQENFCEALSLAFKGEKPTIRKR